MTDWFVLAFVFLSLCSLWLFHPLHRNLPDVGHSGRCDPCASWGWVGGLRTPLPGTVPRRGLRGGPVSAEYENLPPISKMEEHPEDWCDSPILWFPPDHTGQGLQMQCHLGVGHTNDHMSIFGSDEHGPPVSVELRWTKYEVGR